MSRRLLALFLAALIALSSFALAEDASLVSDVTPPQDNVTETIETPTAEPTAEPTIEPTIEPTVEPTIEPPVKPVEEAAVVAETETEDDPLEAEIGNRIAQLDNTGLSESYARAKWLYGNIIDTTEPDETLDTAEAVLLQGRGNSAGYAHALKLLLEAADIECTIVTLEDGTALISAKFGEQWMQIDAYTDDVAGTKGAHFAFNDEAVAASADDASALEETLAPTGIVPAESAVTLGVGQTISVADWHFLPEGATGEETAVYTSSKPKVASVDADGTLKAVAKGSAVITISVGDLACTIAVNVLPAPKRIYLSADKTTLGIGETATLSVTPYKGSAASYTFASNNTSVVTVDGTCITAVGLGKAKITATSHNRRKSTITVTVKSAPTTVTTDVSDITLGVGETYALKASPNAGSAGAISYTAGNGNITVDASGNITAVCEGEGIVTVSAYNGQSAECRVHVIPAPTKVTLTTSDGRTVYGYGEKVQLTWSVDDREAAAVTFASSNNKYATVSATGLVTFKKRGNVTVTATTYNGVSAEITLSCKRAPSSVSLSSLRSTLGLGESIDVTPAFSKDSTGSYSIVSDKPDIISVSGNTITAKAIGTARITLTTFNRKRATKNITVCTAPASLTLDAGMLELGLGEGRTLTASLTAGSAGGVHFESSDASVVTIDASSGIIVAAGLGSARVTATTYNGLSATCDIVVKNAPESILLDESELVLSCGDTYQLSTPVLQGENVADVKIGYKSSKYKLVSVSESGLITALRTGSSTITLSTYNGKTATVNVTVKRAPKSITVSPSSAELCMNEELYPEVKFNTGAIGHYTLDSSNRNVAVITEDGLGVRIVGGGTATITVTSYNKKTASMTVTGLALPTEITLSPDKSRVGCGESLQLKAAMPAGQGSLLRYESDNTDVASVDSKGLVQTCGVGSANITVYTQNNLSATSHIDVLNAPAWLRVVPENAAYSLSEKGFTLGVLFPNENEGGSVSFESSDTGIATVGADGEVCFVSCGTVTLTATGYNGHKANCVLTVGETPKEMHFAQEAYSIAVGDCVSIPAQFTQGAESYAFSVTAGTYASVNGNMVTGLAVGDTTLTATSASGLTAQCTLHVVAAPQGLVLSQKQLTLVLGKDCSVTMDAHPEPEDAGTLRYSSSDPEIVRVDVLSGEMTPLKLGDCIITVTTYDGRFSESCDVHVSGLLEGVKIGIDPGHQRHANSARESSKPTGGRRKAKVAGCPSGTSTKIPEYVTNLEIGLQLRDALESLGAEVKMTRTTHDVDISNQERAKMMNAFGADLVLRLHCNGWHNGTPHGISMIVSKTWGQPPESLRAAELLMDSMISATGAHRRGIGVNDEFTGNNWSTVPCILVEMGFISNSREDRLLNSPEYQQTIVRAMVNGICDYMGRDRPVIWGYTD